MINKYVAYHVIKSLGSQLPTRSLKIIHYDNTINSWLIFEYNGTLISVIKERHLT